MLKFAANLSTMFGELPFTERFAAAAAAGFRGVEMLFPYAYPAAQLRALLRQNNLQMVLFNTAPGDVDAGEWGVAAIPGREEEARHDIDLALEYALALKCPQVHVMAATVPPGADREHYRQTFIANMRYAAGRFAPHDIRLLIEALNPVTKPGYLYASQYETLAMAQSIGWPNVFLQLDLFHAQIVDGNLSHLIDALAGRYRHIQLASVPDRHEPDEGEINYPWVLARIEQSGYQGWIGCEYFPRADTRDGLGWFAPYRA